jgi:hypothetical protein
LIGPALVMTLLAIYPVAKLRVMRGHEWKGSFAYLQGDELIYASYVNSLRTGRPRENNPYLAETGVALGESAYSIQFLPPYAIATMARWFGLSTSAAFAVLLMIVAFASSLVLYWLIVSVTDDERLAATGVLFVLCLGSVPTLWGLLQILRGLPPDFSHLRFLRRFAPAAAFPFFFAFCALVWRMLTTPKQDRASRSSLLAGATFGILVFSYFYCWTAALAWLVCLALLWLLFRPAGWQSKLKLFGLMTLPMTAAFIFYGWLLTERAPNQIAVTILAHTHKPDLLRVPLLISIILLLLLLVLSRAGRFNFRSPASLFATSFLFLPFLSFNQQIVTGLSMQPTHYEVFVANYCILLAIVLIAGVLFANFRGTNLRTAALVVTAMVAVGWGSFEVAGSTAKFAAAFITRDEATPVALRLVELGDGATNGSVPTDQVILATDPIVADYLPTISPQPLLWAPHMYGFAGITPAEDQRRLLAFLYYTGVKFDGGTAARYEGLDAVSKFYFSNLLGRSRTDRSLSNTWQPVRPEEYEKAQRAYADFIASFDRDTASRPTLTFVLTESDRAVDLANLDRWYERDQGEQIGKFILYRVTLRPK